MRRIWMTWALGLVAGACLFLETPAVVFASDEPPFGEIAAMIQKEQFRPAFIAIREHQSRVKDNREWVFRLEVLRVLCHLSFGKLEYAIEALGTARDYYLEMSSEEKERQQREYTLLVNDVTERLYQYKYLGIFTINKYSKAMTDDRGRMATDLFWGCFHLRAGRHKDASKHFESAGRMIERMMKTQGDEIAQDTYFLVLAGRVYTQHMQSFIQQGKVEKAKGVGKEMIKTLKLPPAAVERHEAWFAAEVDRYRMQSKCRAEVAPVMNRMVRLIEKGDTAGLQALLTQPSPLPDYIVSRAKTSRSSDFFWSMIDVVGDTDIRLGARITLEFMIHGSWINRFTPKAERYEMDGIHHDMTMEDVRDVLKQEHGETRSHSIRLAHLQAVFLFDGAVWKIEKLVEP